MGASERLRRTGEWDMSDADDGDASGCPPPASNTGVGLVLNCFYFLFFTRHANSPPGGVLCLTFMTGSDLHRRFKWFVWVNHNNSKFPLKNIKLTCSDWCLCFNLNLYWKILWITDFRPRPPPLLVLCVDRLSGFWSSWIVCSFFFHFVELLVLSCSWTGHHGCVPIQGRRPSRTV